MAIALIGRSCFYFIGVFIESLGMGEIMSLAIGKAVLIWINDASGFFELFLW